MKRILFGVSGHHIARLSPARGWGRVALASMLLTMVVGVGAGSAHRTGRAAGAARSALRAKSTDAFAVFSVAAGKRDPRFPRMVRDANHDPEVLAVTPDGSGGWFVGGNFGKRDGVPCPNLAHFTSNGKYDSRFCPAPNNKVVALLADRGVLYVAGSFTRVGGAPRNYVAAIDTAEGRLQQWNPNIAGKIYYDRSNPIPRGVWALAVRKGTLYIAGQFDSVAGSPRQNVAALQLADAKPTAFRATRIPGPSFVVVTDSSVIVDRYGSVFALNPQTGKTLRWSLEGPPAVALVSYGKTVIAAHSLRFGNEAVVAQYQTATGHRLRTIASTVSGGSEISTLHLDGSRLYVGGVFSRVSSTARQSLVSFNLPSRRPLPWHPVGAREGFGVTLAIATTSAYVAVGVGTCRPNC